MQNNSENLDKLNDSFESAYQTLQRKKSNLAFAFFCLEKSRAKDMEILYAYCRILDDISDDESAKIEDKIESLNRWEIELQKIYNGGTLSRFGEELKGLVNRRGIPYQYMQDIITGVRRDTVIEDFQTSEDLKNYCYGVASAVGLCSIYVFGFKNKITEEFAKSLGYALQYTNILRDIVYDYHTQKRVYIPNEELSYFDLKKEDLADPQNNPNCKKLFRMLHFRAKHYFNKSRRLLCNDDKKSMLPALIMSEIYEAILDKIAKNNFKIELKITKLSKSQKIYYALKAIVKSKLPKKESFHGNVSILGAGISGVSSALDLCYKGLDVAIFEAKDHVGGRARSFEWKEIGVKLDNGSHALMGCYKNFIKFFKMLGTEDSLTNPRYDMPFYFDDKKRLLLDLSLIWKNPFKFFTSLKSSNGKKLNISRNALLLFKIKFNLTSISANQSAEELLDANNVGEYAKELFWKPFCESALNTPLKNCCAKIFSTTLKKSLLKGFGDGAMIFFKDNISDAFYPVAKNFLECCGSKVNLNAAVTALNFDANKLMSFSTIKQNDLQSDLVLSALDVNSLRLLLHKENPITKATAKISTCDIMNFHFTTKEKLFEDSYAMLVSSPIHWVFDKSYKLNMNNENLYLYSATISSFDSSKKGNLDDLKNLLENEIKTYFKDIKVENFMPYLCKDATISADYQSENSRPKSRDFYSNFFLLGDWVDCDLPCTMESATFNSFNLKI